ncbi:MAG TPA: hypothetical protein VI488_15385 [Candidatus Angelobacter sp.]
MSANKLAHAAEQASTGLSDIADRLKDFSETVAEHCKETYHDAERGARKLRIAADEGIADTRKQIKSHPLAAVAVVASGAFFLGGVTGWLTSKRRR